MEMYTPDQIKAGDVEERIRNAILDQEFRPCVSVIAIHTCDTTQDPAFLFVQSAKEELPIYWPVQGGIKHSPDATSIEYIGNATEREMRTETGILVCPDFTTVLGGVLEHETPHLRGEYAKGKLFVGVSVDFCESALGRSAWQLSQTGNTEIQDSVLLTEEQAKLALEYNAHANPRAEAKAVFTVAMIDQVLALRSS